MQVLSTQSSILLIEPTFLPPTRRVLSYYGMLPIQWPQPKSPHHWVRLRLPGLAKIIHFLVLRPLLGMFTCIIYLSLFLSLPPYLQELALLRLSWTFPTMALTCWCVEELIILPLFLILLRALHFLLFPSWVLNLVNLPPIITYLSLLVPTTMCNISKWMAQAYGRKLIRAVRHYK